MAKSGADSANPEQVLSPGVVPISTSPPESKGWMTGLGLKPLDNSRTPWTGSAEESRVGSGVFVGGEGAKVAVGGTAVAATSGALVDPLHAASVEKNDEITKRVIFL